jgi:hypothetical protein
MRQRVTPALVVACAALFVALGGTADAVIEQVRPQPRCSAGAVRGAAYVDASLTFPDAFTTTGVRSRFNCARGGVQARRVGFGVYEVRFPRNAGRLLVGNTAGAVSSPTALQHDTYLSWDQGTAGSFRVFMWDSAGNPVEADFAVALY